MWVESILFRLILWYLFISTNKHSLSSDQCVNKCDRTEAFNAHGVISRERLPQIWDYTDTMRSTPVLKILSNTAGLTNVLSVFLYQTWCDSIFCIQLFPSRSKNLIFAVDEHNTENVRSGYHYDFQWQFQDRRQTPLMIYLGFNWAYCIHAFGNSSFMSTTNFTNELFKLTLSCRKSYSLTNRLFTALHRFSFVEIYV